MALRVTSDAPPPRDGGPPVPFPRARSRTRHTFDDGRGGAVTVDAIVCEAAAWPLLPEASDASWDAQASRGCVVATRVWFGPTPD